MSGLDSIYFQHTVVYPVNISGYVGCMITTERTDVEFVPVVRVREEDVGTDHTGVMGENKSKLGKRPYSFVDTLQ